jgi:hypothetical protein
MTMRKFVGCPGCRLAWKGPQEPGTSKTRPTGTRARPVAVALVLLSCLESAESSSQGQLAHSLIQLPLTTADESRRSFVHRRCQNIHRACLAGILPANDNLSTFLAFRVSRFNRPRTGIFVSLLVLFGRDRLDIELGPNETTDQVCSTTVASLLCSLSGDIHWI